MRWRFPELPTLEKVKRRLVEEAVGTLLELEFLNTVRSDFIEIIHQNWE
jgi:hypothetical protein